MIRVVTRAENSERARRIGDELRQMGFSVESGEPARGDVVVAVLGGSDASDVLPQVVSALDLGLHIVVARLEPFTVPKLIDHLQVIDVAALDFRERLQTQVEAMTSGALPYAMRVRTPKVKRSNRSAGIVVGGLALMMFIVGVIGVAVFGIQAPQEEYDAVDTEVALTRDYFAGPELLYFSTWLPRSTEDAMNYEATLQQLPTAYRPLMGLTVTAYALGTPLPLIATPVPEG
ncbi:MAG: hypothetical protein JNL42_08110 [Anaerolineae bacterium]|nr:hypothetical protein [Anaerolineae bacterium]